MYGSKSYIKQTQQLLNSLLKKTDDNIQEQKELNTFNWPAFKEMLDSYICYGNNTYIGCYIYYRL